MGLLDHFRTGVRPAWTRTVAGTLWRVVPASPEIVICEERDTDAKRTTFSALDLATGRVRWSGRRFLDDWWVGVSGVSQGVLFLHGYATPEMPGHRGIVAVDIATGDLLWSDPASSVVEFTRDRVRIARETAAGIDEEERGLRSGERTDLAGETGAERPAAPRVLTPRLVPPGEGIPAEGAGDIPAETIEHPHALVVVTHEADAAGLLQARLALHDPASGARRFDEVVHRGLHVPVRNACSVVNDVLLYIKDGRSLRAIPL